MKKKKNFFFFEIFEKSADFATKFGWGISATKGSPLWKKNEIDQKRYPNISVFFGFHFVFFGFSGTRGNFPLRKKKKNEMDRITPNWTEQLGYLQREKKKRKKLGTVRLRRYLFLPSFMFKHDVLMYSSFYFEYDSTSPLRMISPPSRIKID